MAKESNPAATFGVMVPVGRLARGYDGRGVLSASVAMVVLM